MRKPLICALALAGAGLIANETAIFSVLKSNVPVGKQAGGYYLLPTNQLLRPWGEQSAIPGRPVDMAFDSDKPVAYCWTGIYFSKDKGPGERMGRIYMLGVEPDYRGRGLGRQILLAGISYLESKGVRVVELTVDRENRVAYALYTSVGFKPWKSSLWYEKRLQNCAGDSGIPQ